MKAQASIENIFYYIILFIAISAVVYFIFQYIIDRNLEAQRANIYSFQQYLSSNFISADRLGEGGYVKISLPTRINGYEYNISIIREPNYITRATFYLNINNQSYPFIMELKTKFGFANITLYNGEDYLIINENNYIYIR